jgi:hypothetical protein
MRIKRLVYRILLALFLALTILVVHYREEIRNIFLYRTAWLRAFVDSDIQIVRHRPLSLLKKETELQLYIGPPFNEFNRRQWQDFWWLIYGLYYKELPQRPDLPKKLRQLTYDEIIEELKSRYSEVFVYFKDEHWGILFGLIAEK